MFATPLLSNEAEKHFFVLAQLLKRIGIADSLNPFLTAAVFISLRSSRPPSSNHKGSELVLSSAFPILPILCLILSEVQISCTSQDFLH